MLGLVLAWLTVSLLPVLALRWLPPPTSAFMLQYWLSPQPAAEQRFEPPRHQWTAWENISPAMRLAVVAAEDQKFPHHHGFDLASIQEALTDYIRGDGLRGADGPDRLGPQRLTGSGLVSASQVRQAAIFSVVVALVGGAYLVYVGGPAILAIGIASLLAGYFYSSGPKPLSHGPWGEIFVIVFFGIAAVAGSYYLQMDQAPDLAVLVTGVALGGPAGAVLPVCTVTR